ncbi:MAG: TPM domain-containing protein [Gammaproteobacteria bacterium]
MDARSLPGIFWGTLCLVLCSPLWAQVPVPPLTARIIDQTGTLSVAQRLDLENKLQAFESAKGSQIVVLIMPTTQPEAIEQYSMRVVEQWRLGRKGVDDGALLLVAKDDRKVRIEVDYGLEGVLTDATSKRIISEVITPLFKTGDFHVGIAAGVDRMIRVIEGEPLPPPEPSASSPDDPMGGTVFAFLMAFTVGSVILGIASVLLPRATARLGGAALNGGITGAIAWSLTKALSIALIVAALGFVIALVIGSLPTHRAGRWSSGNWRGGGSGGGGGFSGGGGSFGGGGASGSW